MGGSVSRPFALDSCTRSAYSLLCMRTRSCSSKGREEQEDVLLSTWRQQRSTGCMAMGVCPSGGGLHASHVGTTMRQSKEKKPCARAMSLWPGRQSRCCVANRQAGQSARPGNDWTGGGAAREGTGVPISIARLPPSPSSLIKTAEMDFTTPYSAPWGLN